MSIPVLATKLHIPTSRATYIQRDRLLKRLDTGLDHKLTLVSAPAGFGKTTIITSWLSTYDVSVAWLSLDEDDSEFSRFLMYLVAALQRIDETLGQAILPLLTTPQIPSLDSILTDLVNDLTQMATDFVLVLDDYHVIDSPEIDRALNFLLDNSPPQMHLVMVTREDPNLPLARLRARAQLIELRAADLRFTVDEAMQFLNTSMELNLSRESIETLEQRTEGWIVGLQLAAISMRNQTDQTAFIEHFSGNHQYVLDYLVEEVLQQQPETILNFLLQTSILDHFSADLCDAVVGSTTSSQNILNDLARANLFLISLDHERKWFRYHHLFREILRQKLTQSDLDVTQAHTRASEWYETNGFALQAFQHATYINDVERAERLLEGEKPLLFRGLVRPILNWLNGLSAEVLDEKPSLLIWSAFADSYFGLSAKIDNKLSRAETLLAKTPQAAETRDLLGRIATIRAMLAVPHNEIETLLSQSQTALELLNPNNIAIRVQAMWTLGYSQQALGNRAAATTAYHEVVALSQAIGNVIIHAATLTTLAQIEETDNQLQAAAKTYQIALDLLANLPRRYACEAVLGLGRIAYQQNDLEAATEYGKDSLQLALQSENIDTPASSQMLLAQIYMAKRDFSAAKVELDEAQAFLEKLHFEHGLPLIAERRIQLLLLQGQIETAAIINDAYDLPISSARIELARNQPQAVLSILEPYASDVEAKGWHDEILKTHLFRALACHQLGDSEAALKYLNEVLAVGQTHNFVRLFVDQGQAMQQLLAEALKHGIYSDYVQKLLTHFNTLSETAKPSSAQNLMDPLSERELEVLVLVAEGLSNGEISKRLFITLNTVKGHNRIIFQKLQVNRRTEAVARARELGLI